jgi:hypothetical protein
MAKIGAMMEAVMLTLASDAKQHAVNAPRQNRQPCGAIATKWNALGPSTVSLC